MPYRTSEVSPGAVNYTFAIAKKEINIGQWWEFVQAYAPFYTGNPYSIEILGQGIYVDPVTHEFTQNGSNPLVPDIQSWRMAARYCNWLHNGKAQNKAAFESGAYDTSTFYRNVAGDYMDVTRRMPGARFWIPNLDEWSKAVYFDPHREPGKDGYWLFTGTRDVPPISGLPEEGGQTNAGTWVALIGGSYPNVKSPWGLLDTSGGSREWLEGEWQGETVHFLGQSRFRGTNWGASGLDGWDERLDWLPSISNPDVAVAGLRIATEVEIACPADLNTDRVVDDADFSLFVRSYDALTVPPADPASDLNQDGVVDDLDFMLFVQAYDRLTCE